MSGASSFADIMAAAQALDNPNLSPVERAKLEAKRDHAAAMMALSKPIENPMSVYHPSQVEKRTSKDGGRLEFLRAHGTDDNLALLLNAYGVRVRYNEMARRIETWVAGQRLDGALSGNTNLALIERLCTINAYPYTRVAGNIWSVAARDTYNPALEWVKSKTWDGKPRIGDLFQCLTLTDPAKAEISELLFRKWMRGAAAILSGKASKFEHVLVLVDPTGGIGKTRFFDSLCGEEFRASATLIVDNKDSLLEVTRKWLVELGEIAATFSRSDIEALKGFLSRSHDEIRPPYARESNVYPRRTAFFGSVNNVQFLADDTSNRRFWPIEVSAVNYQHDVDMQQVWAETLRQVESGETWWLSPDENLTVGEHNEGFRSMDRVEELIRSSYDAGAVPCRYMSASDILDEVGVTHAKQTDTRKATTILKKLFDFKLSRGYTVYHMPYARNRASNLSVVADRYEATPL